MENTKKRAADQWLKMNSKQGVYAGKPAEINRRTALKYLAVIPVLAYGCSSAHKNTDVTNESSGEQSPDNAPVVYMTKEISPAAIIAMYEKLGRKATGKVAVKLSMGEPGGHNYLKPELVRDLVQLVNGTIVDCNTAYGGNRATTELHLKAAVDHGFTAIAPIDIMDSEGETELPVTGGKHLTKDIVGSHFTVYDFVVNLSHFKGHAMGGFGGALKNMSIGIASSKGKTLIHSAGASTTDWGNPAQNDFLESMAEAAQAIAAHCGDKIIYISVMNNLSVDCDCDANPEDPKMADIGILASLDPVALDKACVDQVYASTDPGKVHLIERMESRNGIRIVEHAEALGMGNSRYQLVMV
ncbi:MAG: DUF362 domain-containing protein [Bacteroidales bacterium]|jgi:uncharacterized Fe-S center protein|nr:DUF362 domain-containing protein [Bacteroidales bacterium]